LLLGQDSEETLETIVSDRKVKATGYRPVRKAAMSETDVLLSRIIVE